MKKTLLALGLSLMATAGFAQSEILDAALKANSYFMKNHPDPTLPTTAGNKVRTSNLWTRAVYYEGLMNLDAIHHEPAFTEYVDRWANFHKWTARNGSKVTNADDQCCQQVYIERALQLGRHELLDSTRVNLYHEMATGRHDYWTWIDALQMAMPVYAKYAKLSGQKKYIDYAMQGYFWTRDTLAGGLQDRKTGLWWRDKNFTPPVKESDGNYCYWSRGNGWVYAAMARVMSQLPAKSKEYKILKKDFVAMTCGLAACQRADGFWNVSLMSPTTFGGPEMTGTALFLYGLSWGLANGVIGKEYRPACDKAWKALRSCLHDDGFIGWYQGTGKQPSDSQPVTYTSVPDFDDFGTGCYLLGLTEYYKLVTKKN